MEILSAGFAKIQILNYGVYMISRFLIFVGIGLIVSGLLLHFKVDVPHWTRWIGKLPGDLIIKKKHFTLYLPIATSVLASLLLSFVLSLLFKSSK